MLDQLDTLISFALIMLLLSLLITTFVQAFNVVLQRRGFNLLWGVEQILGEMGVERQHTEAIAKRILKYPALAASRILPTYASAIRADELAKVLKKVMAGVVYPGGVPAQPPAWYTSTLEAADALEKTVAQRVPDFYTLSAMLRALGADVGSRLAQALPAPAVTPAQLHAAMEAALTGQAIAGFRTLSEALAAVAIQVVQELNNAVNVAPAAAAAAAGQPAPLQVALPTVAQIRQALESVFAVQMAEVSEKAATLKAWFDTVMDRTSERFVAWTRWVTVISSFVFCVVLQVNGLDILNKLYADKQLRTTLVAQVDPMLKQAGEIMALASTALATQALRELEPDLKAAGYKDTIPSDLDTRAKGENWLKNKIKDPKNREILLAKYSDKFDALAQKRLDDLGANRKDLLMKLGDTQLRLFHVSSSIPAWLKELQDLRHLGGILMAAVLLSLGAPFWFNMLKNLSNLRPIVANRVEEE